MNEQAPQPDRRTPKPPATVPVPPADQPDELTALQRAFVAAFVSGDDTTGEIGPSARAAGYAESAARKNGHHLLDQPQVQQALRKRIADELQIPLAAKAIKVLRGILSKAKAEQGDRTRMAAAFGVLDRGGYVAPKDRASDAPKDFNEMTMEELHRVILDAEDRLSRRARDVTPSDAPKGDTAAKPVAGGTNQDDSAAYSTEAD